jgi:RNA polymerase sigma-70 factor (ECF subfamily)
MRQPKSGRHQETGNPPSQDDQEFHQLIVEMQPRLRGYLASILGGWADVDDLLQETNLVLLQKRGNFEPGTNFTAWSFRIAYFKATTWRRDESRKRRVVFNEVDFQEIAAAAEEFFAPRPPVTGALERCLSLLKPEDRSLVDEKYVKRNLLTDYAVKLGCNTTSLHKRISRIRLVLRKCLQEKQSLSKP